MKVAIVVLLVAISSAAASPGDEQTVQMPTAIQMSSPAAATWVGCASTLPVAMLTGPSIAAETRPPYPVRADILSKTPGGWRLIESWRLHTPRLPGIPAVGHIAILLRPCENDARYWWADIDAARIPSSIRFDTFKSILAQRDTERLYVAGEDEPRSPVPASRRFEHVPIQDALLCETGEGVARCAGLPAAAMAQSGQNSGHHDTRVLRVPNGAIASMYEAGVSILRPRKVNPSVQRAGNWLAVALPPQDEWKQIVVDVSAPGAAVTRTPGSDLVPLPNINVLWAGGTPGVQVSAVVGRHDEPLADDDGILLFLPTHGPELPLAVAHNNHGVFYAPELGSGEYRLKLLASLALSTPITTEISSTLTTARFPAAAQIRGRVVGRRNVSLSSVRVQILPQRAPSIEGEKEPPPVRDLADVAREVSVHDDGEFRVGVPSAGTYVLGVVAGHTRTERFATVRDGDEVTDIGDIQLEAATTVRGVVRGCAGGELNLTPMPNMSIEPGAPTFFDFRRVPLEADGSYIAEGMKPGTWLAAAKCRGEILNVLPTQFALGVEDVVFVDFDAGPQSSKAP